MNYGRTSGATHPKLKSQNGVRKPHAKNSKKFDVVGSSLEASRERVKIGARVSGKKVERVVPRRYVPKGLTEADRKKQVSSIIKGKERPKIKSFENKRSPWAVKFEKKYGFNIKDKRVESIISRTGIKKILDKGRGAYYSSGSRPNQTADSWAYARLASVLMNGPARKVDKDIYQKYKK